MYDPSQEDSQRRWREGLCPLSPRDVGVILKVRVLTITLTTLPTAHKCNKCVGCWLRALHSVHHQHRITSSSRNEEEDVNVAPSSETLLQCCATYEREFACIMHLNVVNWKLLQWIEKSDALCICVQGIPCWCILR